MFKTGCLKTSKNLKQTNFRPKRGSLLVEAMVAVLVASMLGTALVQMYTQVRRVTNMSQGHLYAIALAQECIDQARSVSYASLSSPINMGTHYPIVNGSAAQINDPIFPHPLMRDSALDYTGNGNQWVSQGANYTFRTLNPDSGANDDTVRVILTPAPGGVAGVQVLVTIDYLDTSGAVKRYQTSTVVTQFGLSS